MYMVAKDCEELTYNLKTRRGALKVLGGRRCLGKNNVVTDSWGCGNQAHDEKGE